MPFPEGYASLEYDGASRNSNWKNVRTKGRKVYFLDAFAVLTEYAYHSTDAVQKRKTLKNLNSDRKNYFQIASKYSLPLPDIHWKHKISFISLNTDNQGVIFKWNTV